MFHRGPRLDPDRCGCSIFLKPPVNCRLIPAKHLLFKVFRPTSTTPRRSPPVPRGLFIPNFPQPTSRFTYGTATAACRLPSDPTIPACPPYRPSIFLAPLPPPPSSPPPPTLHPPPPPPSTPPSYPTTTPLSPLFHPTYSPS